MEDSELFNFITRQNNLLSSLSSTERESLKLQNAHYKLANENVSLEYYGAKHIFDPVSPQFKDIEKSFLSYIEGKDLSKTVVLVEGSIPATSGNIEQDIHQTGERGFITHLAKEGGIEVACLEPDRADEVKYLLEEFRPDQIEYYYYLRAIRDYFRPGRIQITTSFEDYSAQLLEQHKGMFANVEEFSDFDFSLINMKRIHKDLTGLDFDQNKRLDIDPRRGNNIINRISRASSNFRDFYHIKAIGRCLGEGYSIFIVNGEDHAVVQRPALEYILSE